MVSPPPNLLITGSLLFFGCAGDMLVGANHCRVDEQRAKIDLNPERLANTLPKAASLLSGESDIYRVPIAQLSGAILAG